MERIAQHASEVITSVTANTTVISKQNVQVMGDVHDWGNAYVWTDGEAITVQFAVIPLLARNVSSGVT
jgi:hypothetical protein